MCEGLLGALTVVDLALELGVRLDQVAGALLQPDLEFLMGLAQRLDRHLAFGDVERDAEQMARRSIRPQDGDLLGVQPPLPLRRIEGFFGYVEHAAAPK